MLLPVLGAAGIIPPDGSTPHMPAKLLLMIGPGAMMSGLILLNWVFHALVDEFDPSSRRLLCRRFAACERGSRG